MIGNLTGLSMEWPGEFARIAGCFSALKIDVSVPSTACTLSEYTFHHRLLAYSVAPLVTIGVLALPSLAVKLRNRDSERPKLQEPVRHCFDIDEIPPFFCASASWRTPTGSG